MEKAIKYHVLICVDDANFDFHLLEEYFLPEHKLCFNFGEDGKTLNTFARDTDRGYREVPHQAPQTHCEPHYQDVQVSSEWVTALKKLHEIQQQAEFLKKQLIPGFKIHP
jgi:hypothetical protein